MANGFVHIVFEHVAVAKGFVDIYFENVAVAKGFVDIDLQMLLWLRFWACQKNRKRFELIIVIQNPFKKVG